MLPDSDISLLLSQVIRLATHVWRECAYRHITDKSQERDLSGEMGVGKARLDLEV